MIATTLLLPGIGFSLIGGFLFINSILVFNSIRYMAAAPVIPWCESNYVRTLPNMLKCLYDAGFTSPWPSRPTALSVFLFRRKLHRILKDAFPNSSRLIQQHLAFWASIQFQQETLQELISKRQMERAAYFLAESRNSQERQHLLAFLNRCKKAQSRTVPSPLDTPDRLLWFKRLKTMNVLLAEHGYSINNEFSMLIRWEAGDEADFCEPAPVKPIVRRSLT